jgi:hypothetical protein
MLVRKLKYYPLFFVCLYCFISATPAQDDAIKIINNTYFYCFGKIPNNSDISRAARLIDTQDTASANKLLAYYLKLIQDNITIQKAIIKTAFEDAYGSASETETDSCLKSKNNAPVTYQQLMDEMKNKLNKNIAADELKIIQRSYNDYFGIQISKEDEHVKGWMDSSVANGGIFYKTFMDEHRLYVITSPAEQKAIINRAFTVVFGRAIKIAEADSWFNTCKYGCAYTDLIKEFEAYKKNNPKTGTLILAPAGAGDVIYIRTGVVLNEACNCTGKKMFLVNADATFSYKVIVAYYSLQSNTTVISQFIIPPHHQQVLGCTKEFDCIHSLVYRVLYYEKV